ncbi:hypothetical protein H6801_02060 [Candidatus Nomurabacteria bacterium]|nr:hypothetical protein [Candidatus Saccharibacteria bacterium]MCB9822132.1 hypothetical protein [Candidatus Nomurabacteria bacterium]
MDAQHLLPNSFELQNFLTAFFVSFASRCSFGYILVQELANNIAQNIFRYQKERGSGC